MTKYYQVLGIIWVCILPTCTKFLCVHVCMCACVHVCMCACVHACVHAYVCVYYWCTHIINIRIILLGLLMNFSYWYNLGILQRLLEALQWLQTNFQGNCVHLILFISLLWKEKNFMEKELKGIDSIHFMKGIEGNQFDTFNEKVLKGIDSIHLMKRYWRESIRYI